MRIPLTACRGGRTLLENLLENQKLSEEIMLFKNQSRGRDIGLDDQDLDYGER